MTKGKLILENETQKVEYDIDYCQIEEKILFKDTTREMEKSSVSLLAEWTRKEITYGTAGSIKTRQEPLVVPPPSPGPFVMDIVELEKEIIKSFKMCASKNKLNVLYQKQFAMQKKYGIEPLWDEIKKDLRLITMKIHPSWDMAKKLHFTVLHAFELCHHQDAYNYLKNKTVFMQLTPWYNTCLIAVPHLIVINTVKKCLDLITDSAHDYAYMYLAE